MDRVDALLGALDQLTKRAEQAADPTPHLEVLRDRGLGAARDDIANSVADADRSFALGRVLADYLAEAADWPQKIILFIDLANKEAGAGGLAPIDEVCAEILDGAEAVKEVLGPQRDLAGALRTLAQLSAGRYPASTPRAQNSCLGKLNAVLAQRPFPLTQAVLLERVAHGIRGIQPLTREGEESDRTAVLDLLTCVTGHGGLLGGRAMVEGLTRRVRMVMGNGGTDLTAEQGIDFVLGHLPSPAVQLGYLLDLSGSDFGAKNEVIVLKALANTVKHLKTLKDLLPASSGQDDFLKAVTELHDHLGSGLLPDDTRELIAKKLRRLLKVDGATKPAAAPVAKPRKPAARAATQDGLPRRRFAAGEYIFRQGDPGDEAYLIAAGKVEIRVESRGQTTVIATLERGDILGEMALIDDQARMASAIAVEATTLTVIAQKSFRARLDRIAEVDRMIPRLLQRYVERLRAQSHHG